MPIYNRSVITHLKLAGPRLVVLLSICFTGMVTHGTLPDSVMSVILVQVIKDKAGKVGSIDNYRPIAFASILSKVLERLILDRLSGYIITTHIHAHTVFTYRSVHT